MQLSITTAGTTTVVVTPCFVLGTCTTIGEDIDEAVNLETDDGIDLFQDIDTKVEDAIQEFEETQFTESFNFDTQIEILVEDDIGNVEFQPLEVYVEESFTDFLETNNLVETFQQELVFENITEEEFYDELTSVMGEELTLLVAPDEMYETDSTNFENINYDEAVITEPNMDIRMETDMDFMPEPNMESDEFYMTETEMETFIEENPNMIEYADDNVVMLKPSEDFRDLENYDDTVMTESEMLDEEVMMDGPPTMTEIKEEEPEIIAPEMKEEEISNEPEMTEVKEEPKQEAVKETNEATETETAAKPETTTETENTSEKTMATSEERETNKE